MKWSPSENAPFQIPQEAIIRLVGEAAAHRYEKSPYSFITVSLAGSTVAAAHKGAMVLDDPVVGRYWFTESVEVSIELAGAEDVLVLRSEPFNINNANQVTSSNQISLNLSTGAFGETLVGQPGAAVTIGTSFTKTIPDFKIRSSTKENTTYRQYKMAASSGGAYSEPRDLGDHSISLQVWHSVPDLALWDLPLVDAVSFRTTRNDRVDRQLKIEVVHTMAGVFGKPAPEPNLFNMFPDSAKVATASATMTYELNLPISKLSDGAATN